MAGIFSKLHYLEDTKRALRNAIDPSGTKITDETPFREYVNYVSTEGDVGGDDGADPLARFLEGELTTLTSNATKIGGRRCMSYISLESASFPLATTIDGKYAFNGRTNLKSVEFPSLLTIDEQYTFKGCSSLTDLAFTSLQSMGGYDFQDCVGLGVIPESSFPYLETIGSSSFQGCTGLIDVHFPAVTTISGAAFVNCSNLKAVDFPSAITIEGNNAFKSCTSLTDINCPAVTTIGNSAFYLCTGLTSVSFPSAITIDTQAFRGCTGLTNVSLPSVTTMIGSPFYGCSSLTEITLPSLTDSGDDYPFSLCSKLKTLSLPALPKLHGSVCANLSELTTAYFPSVTTITGGYQGDPFYGCSKLSTLVLCHACELSSVKALQDTAIAAGTGYIYVPTELVDWYKTASYWSTYADQIRALENYTVDGTIDGGLDPEKINAV